MAAVPKVVVCKKALQSSSLLIILAYPNVAQRKLMSLLKFVRRQEGLRAGLFLRLNYMGRRIFWLLLCNSLFRLPMSA